MFGFGRCGWLSDHADWVFCVSATRTDEAGLTLGTMVNIGVARVRRDTYRCANYEQGRTDVVSVCDAVDLRLPDGLRGCADAPLGLQGLDRLQQFGRTLGGD